MTTEYRDANGKVLRTDKGTRPRGTPEPARPAPPPVPAAATTDAADTAPAKKEK